MVKTSYEEFVQPFKIGKYSDLKDRIPGYALVKNTDLVVIRYDDTVSVLYGRCSHRGALLADGTVNGNYLVCGVHKWDYLIQTGISDYDPKDTLTQFSAVIKDDEVFVDFQEIEAFEYQTPQTFIKRDDYLGLYDARHWSEPEEPQNTIILSMAEKGISGEHGPTAAMGVPQSTLPKWDDIQVLPAQLASFPLLDGEHVETKVVIGSQAKKPLELEIPLFVSDMSFGSLSYEAKVSLAKGAELAGTGICSGEGGMLPEEQQANTKYFYELASGKFGFDWDKLQNVQAFHFKGGQGAKTGTGGHLPGFKVVGKIAEVRNLKEGTAAISPARFTDFETIADVRNFADEVRDRTGGIPIGYKLSANRIEQDIQAALDVGVDYIILDGRGGGTGAAPTIFRDHISVPTIPALARARRYLDEVGSPIELVITGGLRTAPDFVKALALGADAIAVANSAIQAIGCQGMRACNTNNCPVGIATQKPHLRARLDIDKSAERLERFFTSTVDLMKVLTRACGVNDIKDLNRDMLTTFKKEMHHLSGVSYAGMI